MRYESPWVKVSDPIVWLGGPVGPCCFDCGGERGQELSAPLFVAYTQDSPSAGCELVCGDCIAQSQEGADA